MTENYGLLVKMNDDDDDDDSDAECVLCYCG